MISASSGCATLDRPDDDWFARDKMRHFAASAAISAGITHAAGRNDYSNGEARMISIGCTPALGAGLELFDRDVRGTYFSWKDMTWNLLGAVAGNLLASQAD